ncbi:hypothetical protein RSA3_00110 [Microbacterium testaceum]|uniref:Cell filamentation protein Fic n=1 Tax=Microbacterium testaceum TaxID=2033 RepID=A0A147FCN5_MICTE|nr:hypothetical protein RSA3_00110 [Microbacterium testaceum]
MRNKLGESDQSKLTAMEEAITAVRLGELRENPIAGRFDYEHMKAIHKHVFQRPERPPRDEP